MAPEALGNVLARFNLRVINGPGLWRAITWRTLPLPAIPKRASTLIEMTAGLVERVMISSSSSLKGSSFSPANVVLLETLELWVRTYSSLERPKVV